MPKQHKVIETTEIMLQMVASGRGVAALPRWIVKEYADKFDVFPVKLGVHGVDKQIFLGVRDTDSHLDYLQAFLALARTFRNQEAPTVSGGSVLSPASSEGIEPNSAGSLLSDQIRE